MHLEQSRLALSQRPSQMFVLDFTKIARPGSDRRAVVRGGMMLMIGLVGTTLAACQSTPTCPEVADEERFLTVEELATARAMTPAPAGTPIVVEVGSSAIVMDRVVNGALCNDNWQGNVYVTCDVKVPAWSETPTFLETCDLKIEPNTVVYVAAHNNAAYYKGCSCHTGELGEP